MEQRSCSFCGEPIEPGTGTMFVKKDGSTYYFDRRRCQASLLTMGRIPRKFKWTRHYPRGEKSEQQLMAEQAAVAAKVEAETPEAAPKAKKPAKAKAGK